jgi:hypothetical protein
MRTCKSKRGVWLFRTHKSLPLPSILTATCVDERKEKGVNKKRSSYALSGERPLGKNKSGMTTKLLK